MRFEKQVSGLHQSTGRETTAPVWVFMDGMSFPMKKGKRTTKKTSVIPRCIESKAVTNI